MAVFQYGDTKLYYEKSGTGIPILFLHPPGMGRKVFYYQIELGRFFTVIFPDLSGNGDTIGPERHLTIDDYVEEVKALLDYLQIEAAVLASYSSGGCIAQEFALKYPEQTLGLVLMSSYPEVASVSFKYEHMAGAYVAKQYPLFLSYILASIHTENKELRDILNDHMKKANPNMWSNFYEQALHFNCTEQLGDLRKPLLLMYGSRDFANQHIRNYNKHTPYQAVIFKKVSHQIPTKRWQQVNQVMIGFILEQIQKTH
jgi:pimeloyl-ACP methyl ester carboxylesterase